jgi:hypothetical protein
MSAFGGLVNTVLIPPAPSFSKEGTKLPLLNSLELEISKQCLEISRLLITKRSPVTPVDDEHHITDGGIIREVNRFPGDELHFQPGKIPLVSKPKPILVMRSSVVYGLLVSALP